VVLGPARPAQRDLGGTVAEIAKIKGDRGLPDTEITFIRGDTRRARWRIKTNAALFMPIVERSRNVSR
jgi:hypothetical protein